MNIHPKIRALQKKLDAVDFDKYSEKKQDQIMEAFIQERDELAKELEKSEGLSFQDFEEMRMEAQREFDYDREGDFVFVITPEMAEELNTLWDKAKTSRKKSSPAKSGKSSKSRKQAQNV